MKKCKRSTFYSNILQRFFIFILWRTSQDRLYNYGFHLLATRFRRRLFDIPTCGILRQRIIKNYKSKILCVNQPQDKPEECVLKAADTVYLSKAYLILIPTMTVIKITIIKNFIPCRVASKVKVWMYATICTYV